MKGTRIRTAGAPSAEAQRRETTEVCTNTLVWVEKGELERQTWRQPRGPERRAEVPALKPAALSIQGGGLSGGPGRRALRL